VASSRFSAVKPRPTERRLGSETPRVWTPPLRPLTPKTSLGFSVIEFATDVLGIELFPWQRWLLVHALELRAEGGFRFRNVVVLVARQNGKSTLSQVLSLWFMYVYGFDLVLGTAQDLDTAEEIWQGAVDLVTEVDEDDVPVRPELLELWQRTVMVNGKKSLELKTGSRYKAKAANRRAGRGLSGDLVMLDELREHQTWDAWGAITKTTMARDEAMVWALSNAGDSLSAVLTYLRKLAHAALGDPDGINSNGSAAELLEAEADVEDLELDEDDDSLGIFEWSATPGCDVWDRDEWARANPSLGYKISERTIASAARTDPDAIFRTEVLCQWVDQMTPSAIDPVAWAALADADALRGDRPVFGVAVSPDREWSAIAVAWRRPDGLPQVQLAGRDGDDLDYRPTTSWVKARVESLRATWNGSVVLSPTAKGLVPDAEELSPSRQAAADVALADAVTAQGFRHGNQPALRTAVKGSRWPSSGVAKVLEPSGEIDISPLKAVAAALSGLDNDAPPNIW
jgi:hypothetical protein